MLQPSRLQLGLLLIALAWPLNWGLDGLRTHVLFFPLWLGYVLVVDGWCEQRTGTSAWRRSRARFVGSFLLSPIFWWLFELANLRLRNWEYVGREHFDDLTYACLASLAFSTVFPAVLGTAELVSSFGWIERFARGPRLLLGPSRRRACLAFGLGGLLLMLAYPRVFYPLVWVSGVFLLESWALARRRPALSDDLVEGDWRPWFALWSAGLICGFLWEMWNALSYPKWIYHVPGLDFARVFEMPLLGYLGYLPFSMEVFLLSSLVDPELVRGVTAGPTGRAGRAIPNTSLER